jgi:uncharacterized DUF497 family protein
MGLDDNAWLLCYVLPMPRIAWNADKNQLLQQTRGVSFEEVAQIIEQDGPRAILAHHNLQRYPNQRLYIVVIRGYAYIERVAEFHWRSSGPPILPAPLYPSSVRASVQPLVPLSYEVSATKSLMNLFRLKDKIDRGPAISSVGQRRSLGLLNLYRLLFNVPMLPSVRPRSLRI